MISLENTAQLITDNMVKSLNNYVLNPSKGRINVDFDKYLNIFTHLNNQTGKLIRPKIVLSFAQLIEPKLENQSPESLQQFEQTVIDYATAIELTHISSLFHDDIIDHDDFRRGIQSVNKKYGLEKALISGDLLFADALFLVQNHTTSTKILNTAFSKMCYGQMFELMEEIDNKDKYYTLIANKTTALFQAAGQLGMLVNQNYSPEQIKTFHTWLYGYGLAFQIADDLDDDPELLKSLDIGEKDLIKVVTQLPVFHQDNEFAQYLNGLAQNLITRK